MSLFVHNVYSDAELSNMAIYIPRIALKNAYLKYIRDAFHYHGIGWVARVCIEPRRDAKNNTSTLCSAVVYMQEWYDTENAWDVWNTLLGEKYYKLYFDYNDLNSNYYWMLLKSNAKNSAPFVPETIVTRLDRLEGQFAQYKSNMLNYLYEHNKKLNRLQITTDNLDDDLKVVETTYKTNFSEWDSAIQKNSDYNKVSIECSNTSNNDCLNSVCSTVNDDSLFIGDTVVVSSEDSY